ncbi:hypothetical protein ACNZ61_002810 [Enterococcus hirae]
MNEYTDQHIQSTVVEETEPIEKKKKQGSKKKKKKTVFDLDDEIEKLKKKREKLYNDQVTELGKKMLEILKRCDISLLEITNELDLFYEELEEVIEQNKENLKAIVS